MSCIFYLAIETPFQVLTTGTHTRTRTANGDRSEKEFQCALKGNSEAPTGSQVALCSLIPSKCVFMHFFMQCWCIFHVFRKNCAQPVARGLCATLWYSLCSPREPAASSHCFPCPGVSSMTGRKWCPFWADISIRRKMWPWMMPVQSVACSPLVFTMWPSGYSIQ